jgi:hypothetical protein
MDKRQFMEDNKRRFLIGKPCQYCSKKLDPSCVMENGKMMRNCIGRNQRCESCKQTLYCSDRCRFADIPIHRESCRIECDKQKFEKERAKLETIKAEEYRKKLIKLSFEEKKVVFLSQKERYISQGINLDKIKCDKQKCDLIKCFEEEWNIMEIDEKKMTNYLGGLWSTFTL